MYRLRLYVTNILISKNEPRFYMENDNMKEPHAPENTHSIRFVDLNHEASRIMVG